MIPPSQWRLSSGPLNDWKRILPSPRRCAFVVGHLLLVVALVVSPAAPFVDSTAAQNSGPVLTEERRHTIQAYLSDSQTGDVTEPVVVNGSTYAVVYVKTTPSQSGISYRGNLGGSAMEKQVAYGTDWEQVGLDAVLVFELTDSGARFVPKSEHELIRQVIQVQAAVAWRQRDHFRADGPHSWVVDFQEGMLHEGVANAAFAWEKATGFKSREDRYLAALQGMTSTSGQRYIPEEIRDEITTADSALQSAQAASSAARTAASGRGPRPPSNTPAASACGPSTGG